LKLAVRLSATLLERVDDAARRCGLRRSEFVRRALSAQSDAALGSVATPTLYDILLADGVPGRFIGPPGLSTTSR
jgi:hypothetical protein